jgi:hypothetical protein
MPHNSAALNRALSKSHEDLASYEHFVLNIQREIAGLVTSTRVTIDQSQHLMQKADRALSAHKLPERPKPRLWK